jgi:hypothetical protein
MHILCPAFGYCTNHLKKPTNILCFKCGYCKIILTKLMFISWPLCKYFTSNFMFWNIFNAIMQHCNIFQTHILTKKFNKILMQCLHSKHVNIIQKWGYNCNETKLVCIDVSITSIKTFLNVQKMEKYALHAIVYAKET